MMDTKEKLELALKYDSGYVLALSNLARVYGVYGEDFAKRADEEKKNNHFGQEKQNKQVADESFNKAVFYYLRAIKADPKYISSYRMLGLAYHKLGDEQNAAYYLSIYEKMKGK